MNERRINELTYLDYEVINLVMIEGLSVPAVSKLTTLSTAHIRRVMGHPDVKQILLENQNELASRLRNLLNRATDKLNKLLDSGNDSIVHRAIETIYRTQGLYKEVVEGRITAEDIVQKMLEKQKVTLKEGPKMEVQSDVDLTVFDEKEVTQQ